MKISNEKGVRLVKKVGAEVEANFKAWFTRNFVDSSAGRIGGMSYSRAGALDDRIGDGLWYSGAYDRAWADYNEPATSEELAYITSHPLIALQLCAGITDMRGLRCLRRGLTARVNALQQKSYRSRYYARDNARRRLLAAERRKITRRTTLNPCPTPDEFRRAFGQVRESLAAKLHFGGLVHDLECYVDNCLRIDEHGDIVGRNGGIKAWIAEFAPELYGRYKTIMRYKALAKRVRQAVEVNDPVPLDALLDGVEGAGALSERESREIKAGHIPVMGGGGKLALCGRRGNSGVKNYYASNSHHRYIESRRLRLAEMFAGCGNTILAAFARVDAELLRIETMSTQAVAGTWLDEKEVESSHQKGFPVAGRAGHHGLARSKRTQRH